MELPDSDRAGLPAELLTSLPAVLVDDETEGGSKLADRFFAEAEEAVARVPRNPQGFHFIEDGRHRVSLESFPYNDVDIEIQGPVDDLAFSPSGRTDLPEKIFLLIV